METDQKRRIIEDGSRCGWVDGTVDKFPFIGSQEVGRGGSDVSLTLISALYLFYYGLISIKLQGFITIKKVSLMYET